MKKITRRIVKLWKLLTIENLSLCFFYLWNRLVRRIRIDKEPTFIVGCGHSGTSVLLAILDAHSRMYAIPGESRIAEIPDVQKFKMRTSIFDKLAVANGKNRWIEKTPRHILQIEKILTWIPEAKIIIIIRDGRDVAYSIKKRTGSLEEGAERWLADNLAGKKFWQHPNVHVIKYEQIISDFELAITDVLTFLDESYEPNLQNFHQKPKKWYSPNVEKPANAADTNHRQHRNWQINQPLFDGRQKWKNLSSEELALFYDKAGHLLAELDYTEE